MVSNRSCFHGRGDLIYRLPTERGFLRTLPCSRNWFHPTTGTTKRGNESLAAYRRE